ncbi:MAG TPA: molybdopterin-dependent oxidoreductase [Steroidobacteraceae bacterium]|nr:molybdopterin-dependent oxidoreductase [Steroidobacteraceae bacterium]
MTSSPTRTTCPYCGVGCGVLATRQKDGVVAVRGDPAHPANRGKLCVKGSALGETLGLDDRLLHPMIDGQRVTWDQATARIASEFRRLIDRHGPESVAFYVSGQLLTEDYYVVNKLMKGYIGAANIDTNSRLCMASAVAGHKRAFGEDVVPVCYEDLECCDLVVLVGSNTAWCHPILWQRLLAARELRPQMRIVALDPRITSTTQIADLHLPLVAGSDVQLFNGLLVWLAEHGAVDGEYVAAHTNGFDAALSKARDSSGDLVATARACGVAVEKLREFYEMFAASPAVITAFSQGVNQSSSGTDKVNAIINCHLATGRIGKPGAGPFSVTGQPNAMGGREVGGFANTLAAHIDVEDEPGRKAVQGFWNSPTVATRQGPKAVDMFDRIHDGRIKAVWIMATNPVVSLPDADRVSEALSRCELVVVSDVMANTDTAELAHVLLPALAWGEKDGMVTNSDRTMSRQRPFLPPPGEARADWRAVCDVARAMGFTGFDFVSPHEIFGEHARLTTVNNGGRRALDIGALGNITASEYRNWEPAAWPMAADRAGTRGPMFGDGRFMHADGRARFIALTPRRPENAPDEEFPLILNTGRVRDHWHTMTRTGKSPRLSAHIAEPFVEVNPADALRFAVKAGELARVRSRWGAMVVRVRTEGEVPAGMVFAPIHWNGAFASDARVGALTNPVVDPVSGEPELKHTPVSIEPFIADWHGVIYTREAVPAPSAAWWTRVQGEQFSRYELVGRGYPDWEQIAREMCGAGAGPDVDWIECFDPSSGLYRGAWIVGDRLQACVYIDGRPLLPDRAWLAGLFGRRKLDNAARASLLSGRPAAGADPGPLVCSCFGVGRNAIAACARELGGSSTAAAIGKKLKCGTNCGSCVAEIQRVIADVAARAMTA